VTKVGSKDTKLKVGDFAAVGCLVGSCHTCDNCKEDLKQYCSNGWIGTYNSRDKYLGGLGHMAIKLAKGHVAEVTLFSRTPGKEKDALELDADFVVISTDDAYMSTVGGKFDLIIDTVPYVHDVNPYVGTLNTNGTLVIVGYLEGLEPFLNTVPMIMGRKSVAGSLIGGFAKTQEMLDFCGEHNIVSEIELIKMQDINEAYERMLKSDVRYRFVINMASLKE
jgi:uncharacterized zinc-type alcohol dehydrogenase-like protein